MTDQLALQIADQLDREAQLSARATGFAVVVTLLITATAAVRPSAENTTPPNVALIIVLLVTYGASIFYSIKGIIGAKLDVPTFEVWQLDRTDATEYARRREATLRVHFRTNRKRIDKLESALRRETFWTVATAVTSIIYIFDDHLGKFLTHLGF